MLKGLFDHFTLKFTGRVSVDVEQGGVTPTRLDSRLAGHYRFTAPAVDPVVEDHLRFISHSFCILNYPRVQSKGWAWLASD